MESKDELSRSKRHDADGGRHRSLRRHGREFLRPRRSKRAQIVGPKNRRRDWRRRHYLFGQWDTKDRRCERSHGNSVANRNHNRQGINTWIEVGVARRLRAIGGGVITYTVTGAQKAVATGYVSQRAGAN